MALTYTVPALKKRMSLSITKTQLMFLEIALIISFAIFPLFVSFPYRVNIFLSWEGAYRLYLGQVPYKDFGIPMGYAYWLIPALFFKIFGPYLFSLIKAQVFINIVSGLSFRSILSSININPAKRFLSVLLFCLSYSFFNFWPWYNQTVFVYQLVGLCFFFLCVNTNKAAIKWTFLFLCSFFTFMSFFTKQDGGGLAIMLAGALVTYTSLVEKDFRYLLFYILFLAVSAAALILPFIQYDFLYWFNYGQPPHYSRFSIHDIFDEFFGQSLWLKLYLVIALVIYLNKKESLKQLIFNKKETLFFLLTIGIIVQASIIQVTSYTPPDNNIYFHSFAFAFILAGINLKFDLQKPLPLIASVLLVFFWWSGVYYKYVQRIVKRYLPTATVEEELDRDVISRDTYVISPDTSYVGLDMSQWQHVPNSKAFDRVYMPKETVEGIQRLRQLSYFQGTTKPKVLNMTELTPLAHDLGFDLGTQQPLWYHLNVGIFEKEVKMFADRINRQEYDVVLFEYVPNLNNFYPFELQEYLKNNYKMVDRFLAPRQQTNAFIEVYVKK